MISRKTVSKRIKVTKGGKLLRRVRGVSHNMAKKSAKSIQKKRKYSSVSKSDYKKIRALI
ncbi:MAG: 50S ribosomal protein L35 [Patescibacteria group bacterium]|nr:50S ribosomal protein L35 [Patescibacteria group bacterium]MDE2144404.1 50S ribosomal protein L35 [Patescibacteria group bacterium]